MKFFLLEFIDEFEAFQAYLKKSRQTQSGFTLIALEPRVQAFLIKKNVEHKTTLPYFTNDSHKRILLDSERIMQFIRSNFTFSDKIGLRNCYVTELTHHIRFYVNHMLKMLEILEQVYNEDRNCELFAFVDHSRTSGAMINDAERYVGCLAEQFAKARGLRFTNINATSPSSRTSLPKQQRFAFFSWIVTSLMLRLFKRKKIIMVPIGGDAFKALLATLYKQDKKIAYLAVGSSAGPFKLLAFNIATFFRSFIDPEYYPYYMVDTECFYRKDDQELGRLSSSINSLMGPANQDLFSYKGTGYMDLVRVKVESGLQSHLATMVAYSYNLHHILTALPYRIIMSFQSLGNMAVAGELSRKLGICSLFLSHGTHPIPVDSFHEIELLNLCRGFMLSEYTHVALSTPVQEEHLHYFKQKYAWVDNIEIRTGPLIFSDISRTDRSSAKIKLGLLKDDLVLTHATTTKARHGERFYFLETFDELFASLTDIIKGLNGNMKLIIRIHPGFYLTDDEIRTLLPESPRFIINRQGSFAEVLAATDMLISYSSTAIDEALINRVPVLLFDPWNRYNHFGTEAYKDKMSHDVFPVCYVNDRTRLNGAIHDIMGKFCAAKKEDRDFDRFTYREDYRNVFFNTVEASLDKRNPQ